MRKNSVRLIVILCSVLVIAAAIIIPLRSYAAKPHVVHSLVTKHTQGAFQLHGSAFQLHGSTLLAIGDSLTGGYYATIPQRAYINIVASWAEVKLLPNIAKYGVNVPATLTKLEQIPPPSADIYLIELGTNDTQDSPVVFDEDYRQIISILKQANPAARFVCLGPWQPWDPTTDAIGKMISEACPGPFVNLQNLYEYQRPVLPFHGPAGRPTWLGPGDWFNPNDFGHIQIARAVFAALETLK